MKKDNVDFSKMCKALSLGPVIVPEKLPATEFKHLCNQFGGKMFVIKNEADRQTAMDLYDKEECGTFGIIAFHGLWFKGHSEYVDNR